MIRLSDQSIRTKSMVYDVDVVAARPTNSINNLHGYESRSNSGSDQRVMSAAIAFYERNGFRRLAAPIGETGHIHNDRWMMLGLGARTNYIWLAAVPPGTWANHRVHFRAQVHRLRLQGSLAYPVKA
jgi:hypothetical protein